MLALITYLIIGGIISIILYLSIVKPFDRWLTVVLFFIILIFILNSIFSVYIFFSNRSDVRKKVWLLFFAFIPIISICIFLWFGYNPFSKKIINNFNNSFYKNIKNKKIKLTNNTIFDNTQKLLINDSLHNPVNGSIEHIEKIESFYNESIKIIRSAKKYLILNYFILADGNFFRSIINELKLKKDNGVEIYFVYDWVWTKRFKKKEFKRISKELSFQVFKPKKIIVTSKHNNRNHKKYLIADGTIAIYGGANIADEYINQNKNYNYWYDVNFILKGDIVKKLQDSFLFDTNFFAKPKKNINIMMSDNNEQLDLNKPSFFLWDSYPEKELTTCLNVYKNIIPFIREELIISTPYLYPTKELMDLLKNISKMGVKIKFLLPSLPDNKKIVVWLNRCLYHEFLENNIEIYEINAFNHAKYWIIDDELSIVTSVNFDPRATLINYETSMLIKDKKFNNYIKNNLFLKESKNINKITKEIIESKKWKWKIKIMKKISMCMELIL